jgi:ribosomal protein S18 acetylase RimI-like enzyme
MMIRNATQQESDSITILAREFEIFGNYIQVFQAMLRGDVNLLQTFGVIHQPELFVSIDDNTQAIKGFAAVEWTRLVGKIHGIATAQEYRRMGIATALIKHIDRLAFANNIDQLETLTAETANPSALELFQRNGFVVVDFPGNYQNGQRAVRLTKQIARNRQV